MKTFFLIYSFGMGICIGSFLNVLIYRIPLNLNVARGRSFCPFCKHNLGAIDLVPIFSFVFLKAKCRYCKEKISFRYPIIELITGIIYFIVTFLYYPDFKIIFYCFILSLLLVITLIDYNNKTIPPALNMIIIFSSFIYIGIFDFKNMYLYFFSSLFIILPFLVSSVIANLFCKKTFGMGDIKLMFGLGLSIPIYNSINMLFIVLVSMLIKLTIIFLVRVINDKLPKIIINKSFAFADTISVAYFLYIIINFR